MGLESLKSLTTRMAESKFNFWHPFQKLYWKIETVFKWLPTIWNDQQWDHDFLYLILQKKLELMEDFFRHSKYVHIADASEVADEIHYCKERLDRIVNNEYLLEALKPFDEKYPNYDWSLSIKSRPVTDPEIIEWPGEDDLVEWYDDDPQELQDFKSECYKNSDKMQKKDLDELFSYMREKHLGWWD